MADRRRAESWYYWRPKLAKLSTHLALMLAVLFIASPILFAVIKSTQSTAQLFTIRFERLDIDLQLTCLIGQVDHFLLQAIDGCEPGNGLPGFSELGGKICLCLLLCIECLPNLFFLLRLKNHDTCRFSLEQVQLFPLFALPLMDTDGYLAVDLGTCYLLQDRSPIIRCRL